MEALEKQITFVDMPEAALRSALLSFGFPEWQADGLVEDYAHYRRGEASAISPAVQDVTGLPPHTFLEFASDYKQAFLHSMRRLAAWSCGEHGGAVEKRGFAKLAINAGFRA